MITYMERRKLIKSEENQLSVGNLPSCTIIVPCFNEESTIANTLQSLLELDYPKNKLCIVAVNDGSTDETPLILKSYEKFENITIYHKENGGKHTALNLGLDKTQTELVGCLDADSYVHKDALKKIAVYFDDSDTMAVTPSIRVHNPKNIFEKIQNIEYNYGSFVRKIFSHMNCLYVTPGPFSIFRRSVFTDIGFYKPAHNTEDIEIALRMQSHKFKIKNCHKAFVDTTTPRTFVTLYKQRLRWTYGFIRNALDYKHMFFRREHGNLGLFALPLAPIYIISALYIMFTLLFNVLEYALEYIARVRVTGIQAGWPQFNLDWYFVNTDTKTFLWGVSLLLLVTIIILGHRFADKKVKLMDFVYTFILYGIISPSWLFISIYKTLFRKKTTWR